MSRKLFLFKHENNKNYTNSLITGVINLFNVEIPFLAILSLINIENCVFLKTQLYYLLYLIESNGERSNKTDGHPV